MLSIFKPKNPNVAKCPTTYNDKSLDEYSTFDMTEKLFNMLAVNDVSFLFSPTSVFLEFDGINLITKTTFTEKFKSINQAIEKISYVSKHGYVPILRKCDGGKVFKFLTQEEEILDEVFVKGAVVDRNMTDVLYECKYKNFSKPIDFVNFLNKNGCSIDVNDHIKIREIYQYVKTSDFNHYIPENVFVEKWKTYTKHLDSK